jgi:hypothetical protein
MSAPSEVILTRQFWATPGDMLRAGCVALCVCVSACGGGGDDAMPPQSSVSTPVPIAAPNPAPGTTQPLALSIDSAAGGNPVSSRVALSANGDGFAVWLAHDGTRRNLWANRYRAATAAWESPAPIEATGADIGDFDLTVDASGNAVVAWHEVPTSRPSWADGMVMSARFNAGAGAWAAPVLLNAEARQPRVASNATGAVLAVYVQDRLVRGRFFDPVGDTWQPEAAIEQNTIGVGESSNPLALVDGSGHALVYWRNTRTGVEALGSSYFWRGNGGWPQLAPGETGLLGGVAGSFVRGTLQDLQLTAAGDGNFLAAWGNTDMSSNDNSDQAAILVARFTSGTRAWSAVQTLVPDRGQNIQLQRMGSDARGKALVLWTETVGARRALKALRVDDAGAACGAVHVIDSAVGGGAARADLGVDPQGLAIAIWQQFEGGNADDGSRSNIAINRFDGATGWADATFAETQPGNAISPHASASGGRALLGWIQAEEGANRVKALLQPLY